MLSAFLTLKSAQKEYMDKLVKITKKSTDFANLSTTDLELLALSYEMHEKAGILNQKTKKVDKNPMKEGFFSGADDYPNQGWIMPQQMSQKCIELDRMKVALMTEDFDMQNVALKTGMNVLSSAPKLITEIKFFVDVCYFCGLEVKRPDGKVFCPHCGQKGIRKIGATLEKNGTKRLHISRKFKINPKAFTESCETFKGGKHPNSGKLSHGHRVAQQKVPKKVINAQKKDIWGMEFGLDGNVFAQRDLNSRAAKWNVRAK